MPLSRLQLSEMCMNFADHTRRFRIEIGFSHDFRAVRKRKPRIMVQCFNGQFSLNPLKYIIFKLPLYGSISICKLLHIRNPLCTDSGILKGHLSLKQGLGGSAPI